MWRDSPALTPLFDHAAAAYRSQTRCEAVLAAGLALLRSGHGGLVLGLRLGLGHLHGLLLGVVLLLWLLLLLRVGLRTSARYRVSKGLHLSRSVAPYESVADTGRGGEEKPRDVPAGDIVGKLAVGRRVVAWEQSSADGSLARRYNTRRPTF